MAHDWSGLLGAIEAHSVPRASSLIDEDEELRRRRASALRVEGQAPEQRFMPTGIASKARWSAVPASGPTIASILQPPQSSQRGVIALVGALGAQRDRDDDDENLRSAGGGASSAARPVSPARVIKDRSAAEVTSRAAIAAGAQPVVIKVTSTVSIVHGLRGVRVGRRRHVVRCMCSVSVPVVEKSGAFRATLGTCDITEMRRDASVSSPILATRSGIASFSISDIGV